MAPNTVNTISYTNELHIIAVIRVFLFTRCNCVHYFITDAYLFGVKGANPPTYHIPQEPYSRSKSD